MHLLKWGTFPLFVLLPLTTISSAFGFDPFTLTGGIIAVTTGSLYSAWQLTKCKLWECCQDPWLTDNLGSGRVLRRSLEDRVYGQHIAIDMVTENVRAHVTGKPKKPLVLSFHGGTGVGKNHVTKILAEAIFEKGMNSKFVHLIISTLHFPLLEHVPQYRLMLQEWIRGNLTKCSRNLFIFDEVDKIPAGVLDGLSSFLEYYGTEVDGVDPREAIFIFLSNTARTRIDELTYQAWEAGKNRETLTISDFQKALRLGAFNELDNSGLYHSDLIRHELIDIYVPFLPLERRHVEACVRDYLRENNYTIAEDLVNSVAGELDYFPPQDALFSSTGCKRIREKIVGHSAGLRRRARLQLAQDEL